ncbi:flagellar assembly protein FliH [Sulfurimonas sp.]|uniref:flagellar assembly protein FliH n=1 Tax=Sulfurimonas sp. TaxID=2022749 RepID=UPI0035671644
MATVISNDRLTKHTVDKYTFKVLPMGGTGHEEETEKPTLTKDNNPGIRESDIDSSSMSQSSKDSLIESLMKKTDEMSSNFIKLQMKLESMSEEHTAELEKVKTESFNEGILAGKEQAAKDEETNMSKGLAQFSASVATLEKSAHDYERALEGIKSELISAALDISKEVINIELNESSTAIAEVLSNELIKELQSASKITLKVNPKNHGEISQSIGLLDHVNIISDSAVSEGGVIAISDAGNIDAQISKRFERVKRAALSE